MLLGRFDVCLDGEPVPLGHRSARLVVYLALTGLCPRLVVAEAPWARTSERRALTSLRASGLPVNQAFPRLLSTSYDPLAIRPEVGVDFHAALATLSSVQRGSSDLVAPRHRARDGDG